MILDGAYGTYAEIRHQASLEFYPHRSQVDPEVKRFSNVFEIEQKIATLSRQNLDIIQEYELMLEKRRKHPTKANRLNCNKLRKFKKKQLKQNDIQMNKLTTTLSAILSKRCAYCENQEKGYLEKVKEHHYRIVWVDLFDFCRGCFKLPRELRRWYCSRKCQKLDWKQNHRYSCHRAVFE